MAQAPQPLTRMVNGRQVTIDPQEEAQIRAEWAANEAAQRAVEQAMTQKKARVKARLTTLATQLQMQEDDLRELLENVALTKD